MILFCGAKLLRESHKLWQNNGGKRRNSMNVELVQATPNPVEFIADIAASPRFYVLFSVLALT